MKKLLGLCYGLLLIGNTALAQVTTVDGVGMDKDSAVRDAMRNAVENVIGTFIDSRTLVDKSVVASSMQADILVVGEAFSESVGDVGQFLPKGKRTGRRISIPLV